MMSDVAPAQRLLSACSRAAFKARRLAIAESEIDWAIEEAAGAAEALGCASAALAFAASSALSSTVLWPTDVGALLHAPTQLTRDESQGDYSETGTTNRQLQELSAAEPLRTVGRPSQQAEPG